MPPPLAAALTVLLMAYLLRRDISKEPRPSGAVWIPIAWLLIIGSRQVSQWLNFGSSEMLQRFEEGNPLDQAVYAMLVIAGLGVLSKRGDRVRQVLSNNTFVILFILYEGISFVWSDFPLIALRRWLKALGDPVMVLVLLTDPLPARAITSAISRCAYVLIPLSILFCKYYEHLGRSFDGWGNSFYSGVTLNKNMLGYLLFAFGLFFVAAFITTFNRSRSERDQARTDRIISILLLAMIVWLLLIAKSATATVALIAGTVVMLAMRLASVRRHFWSYTLAAVILGTSLNMWFSLQGTIAEAAGRDASLTGRTGLWDTVLQEPNNPLVGTGYASFWLGDRLLRFWARYPTSPPIQAHNGYIEVYINLGLIGLCLLAGVLVSGLRKLKGIALSSGQTDRCLAAFALPFGVAFLFYNITEAAFGGTNFLFVLFLTLAGGTSAALQQPSSPDERAGSARLLAAVKRRALIGRTNPATRLQSAASTNTASMQMQRVDGQENADRRVRVALRSRNGARSQRALRNRM